MTNRDPSETEIHQVEPEDYLPTDIPVRVEGPVRAQLLPAPIWAVRQHDLDATKATKIANRDPKRQQIQIAAEAVIWIAPVESQAKQDVGFRLPVVTFPAVFVHTEEVWAIADTGTTAVSVSETYWAE